MNLADALGDQSQGGSQWPGQPSAPGWPGQPGQPGQSAPSWPGQPSQPAPTWPGQPGQPTPSWPGQPGGPSPNPTWPGQPSPNPTWPGQPGGPSPNPTWPGSGGGGGTQPNPKPPGPGGWAPTPAPAPMPVAPQKNLKVPFAELLLNGAYDKQLITIAGTILPNPNKFTVDLCAGKDLAFHMNPRFNDCGQKTIVRNSRVSDSWGKEERSAPCFPFTPGRPFEMKILCTNSAYKVAVDGNHLLEFQHRIRDLRSIKSINIHGDVKLSKVLVETIP